MLNESDNVNMITPSSSSEQSNDHPTTLAELDTIQEVSAQDDHPEMMTTLAELGNNQEVNAQDDHHVPTAQNRVRFTTQEDHEAQQDSSSENTFPMSEENTSVIEISEDGTWETKILETDENTLTVSCETNTHAIVFDNDDDDDDASLEDIEKERRRIIENQTVRARRIDSWIKNGSTEPTAEGEVIYDSIIQNKDKTKSYWEQLMMAAASSDQQRIPYKKELSSLGSEGEEFYDACSQVSDSLDCPKIVETMEKPMESVIEREIRLQREREEALAREREEALLKAAPPNTTETKIALELREMREREEELRRLRQRFNKDDTDDGFNSIPNTDSEKDLSLDGNSSRMMSPEVPAGPGSFLHQRTQSMDSMSSGHSSGSGSGSANADMIVNRRRVTVKPLEEPEDDDTPSYVLRNQKETPIEREIRLAREREEELRREKRLPPLNYQSAPVSSKQEVRRINSRNAILANDPRSVQHRLATSRIQQEIDEATEREKELREAGMIQTMSEETVDSKVTRFTDLAEFAIEEQDRKLHKSVSTSHIPQAINDSDVPSISVTTLQKGIKDGRHILGRSSSQSLCLSMSPRKFPTTVGQKGLMQRFLATRGKIGSLSSGFVTNTPSPITSTVTHKQPEVLQDLEVKENGELQRTQLRRGYISAEEKIQVELQEMQKREEELRLQRARMFARSQPNLMCIGNDNEEDNDPSEKEPETLKPLRSTLSNPNLLDSDVPNGDADKPSLKTIKRHSALIAQWENIIQKNIDH